jgi:uncharacterized protein (TIGR03435 family)
MSIHSLGSFFAASPFSIANGTRSVARRRRREHQLGEQVQLRRFGDAPVPARHTLDVYYCSSPICKGQYSYDYGLPYAAFSKLCYTSLEAMIDAMLSPMFSTVFYALLFGIAGSQTQLPEQLKWDVISVKPTSTDSCRVENSGVRFLPNGLSATCVPTIFVVEFAYHLMDPSRIIGLPKWATGPQTYAIEARVSAQDTEAFSKLRRDQKSDMMQSVFAERFGMKAHMETREMPAYSLIIAKSGSKLKTPSTDTTGNSQFGGSTGEVKWVNSQLTDLKFLLAKETGRPVVDHTGLTGRYDFTLEYTPAARAGVDNSGRPAIFTALEEQLGLKLVPTKQSVEVLVVDSLEQPTQN